MLKSKKAFSLIELLVVTAIIAILAAVAIPVYTTYSVRAKVASAYGTVFNFAQTIATQYARSGKIPASVSFNGVTYADGSNYGASTIDIPTNIGNVAFMDYVSNGNNQQPVIRIDAGLSGLNGIPGYVAPTGFGNEGKYAFVRAVIYLDSAGNIQYGCGGYVSTPGYTVDVPMSYQPARCNCYVQDAPKTNGNPPC